MIENKNIKETIFEKIDDTKVKIDKSELENLFFKVIKASSTADIEGSRRASNVITKP